MVVLYQGGEICLAKLNPKQRYRIRRGLANTYVQRLSHTDVIKHIDDLYKVAVDSFSEYPEKYRPHIDYSQFIEEHSTAVNLDYWGCIDKSTNEFCGYAICGKQEEMVHLSVVKVSPQFLNNDVNAALAYTICDYYLNSQKLKYVCDGERNIKHETNYQTFLIKTLGFRLAYCRLNVIYHPVVGLVVKCLYPFLPVVKLLSKHSKHIYTLYCVLKQEKITRSFK